MPAVYAFDGLLVLVGLFLIVYAKQVQAYNLRVNGPHVPAWLRTYYASAGYVWCMRVTGLGAVLFGIVCIALAL
jgi:hypothetical protein